MRWQRAWWASVVWTAIAASIFSQEKPALEAAKPAQPAPRKRALLIGVNDYAFVRNLAYCDQDVHGLQARLIAAGFLPKDLTLMRCGSDQSRYLPFRTNIERELDSLVKSAAAGDLVLVAFSGHGVHMDGVSYLCPIEAHLEKAGETMVSLDRVYQKLEACPAGQKLLLVDACRNNPQLGNTRAMIKPPSPLEKFSQSLEQPPRGILVFTSCKPGQVSVEDQGFHHGVFMHFVLQGLEGEADREVNGNTDSRVSLLELYEFASAKTKAHVARTRNLVQTPMLRGEIAGDYEIAAALPRVPQKLPSRFQGESAQDLDSLLYQDPDVVAASSPAADQALKQAVETLIGNRLMSVGQLSAEDCDKAVAACNEAIRLEPQNAFGYLLRGIAYRKRGDFAQALADFQKVGVPLQVKTLREADLRTEERITGHVQSQDRLLVTEARGDQLLVASVVSPRKPRERSDQNTGWIERKHVEPSVEGDDAELDRYSRRFLRSGDRLAVAAAKSPEALEALQQARGLLAEHPDLDYTRVRSDLTEQQLDQVIAACSKALEAEPENGSAYALRGLAYREKRDFQRALADLGKVQRSLEMSVTSRSAELKNGETVSATASFGQVVQVSQVQGDWLWVTSIDDDHSKQGWISKDAVAQREVFASRAMESVAGGGFGGSATPVLDAIRGRGIPGVPGIPGIPSVPRPSIPYVPSVPGIGIF